ncbi:MAG: hypothetical protein ACSLE0_03155, partial [Chitinophagaceae bacterium]
MATSKNNDINEIDNGTVNHLIDEEDLNTSVSTHDDLRAAPASQRRIEGPDKNPMIGSSRLVVPDVHRDRSIPRHSAERSFETSPFPGNPGHPLNEFRVDSRRSEEAIDDGAVADEAVRINGTRSGVYSSRENKYRNLDKIRRENQSGSESDTLTRGTRRGTLFHIDDEIDFTNNRKKPVSRKYYGSQKRRDDGVEGDDDNSQLDDDLEPVGVTFHSEVDESADDGAYGPRRGVQR